MIKAPWTPAQVDALNAYQALGYVHPFTCAMCNGRVMRATEFGWVCPVNCGYAQNWCHEWMADRSQHPRMSRRVAERPSSYVDQEEPS